MTSTVPRHLRLVSLIFVTVLLVCRSGFSLDNSEIKVLRFLTSSSVRIQVGKEATLVRVGDKVGILACVALLASYFPARRAMRVDPMVTLRYE